MFRKDLRIKLKLQPIYTNVFIKIKSKTEEKKLKLKYIIKFKKKKI